MSRYQCSVCGYVHDEQKEGRKWSDLPVDWTCPVCGSGKSAFFAMDGEAGESTTSTSVLPARIVTQHRIFGYVYLTLYLFFIVQMVPRLWQYQIEFPARTVVHLSLGMAIGAILLVKIGIVRYFRRLDATLVPLLGTALFVSTVVLIGISVPPALREAIMARTAMAGSAFEAENLARVETLLAEAGIDDEAQRRQLASPESLLAGREVLRGVCVECHDLRTVLARPRTPEAWRLTVKRMADRTTLDNAIDEDRQQQVTAYLIAISPRLQQSTHEMRKEQKRRQASQRAAQEVSGALPTGQAPAYDPDRAAKLFQKKCSQCHKTTLVESVPPKSEAEARSLVARMVEEGLSANEAELAEIIRYLVATHAAGAK